MLTDIFKRIAVDNAATRNGIGIIHSIFLYHIQRYVYLSYDWTHNKLSGKKD